MSLAALTSLAVTREAAPPTKGAVGKDSKAADNTDQAASLTDLLVASVPTELVAPYTAVTAAIVGTIASPTPQMLSPDQHRFWRWFVFALLVLATIVLVWEGAKRKGSQRRYPGLEVAAAAAAAIGWALALPSSPLIPYLSGATQTIVPVVVAFTTVIVTVLVAGALQTQVAATKLKRTPAPETAAPEAA